MKQYNEHPYKRNYALVHLDAVEENFDLMKAALPEDMAICAVVKADAYGHGAPAIAWALRDRAAMFAVATVEEGILLRRHGVSKDILVLGVSPEGSYLDLVRYGLMPSIFTRKQAAQLQAKAEWLGIPVRFHLALDTGMGRIGIETEKPDALELAFAICRDFPLLRADGIFTHFATADMPDTSFATEQLQRFTRFVDALQAQGLSFRLRHCANSAGILEHIGMTFNMVRAGIALYGVYPSADCCHELPLRAALELKARVSHIKTVSAGQGISYGHMFVTERETQVATIPIGYADGYPRALSNLASVLLQGRLCRILGRVCMDQLMIDVSGMTVHEGDEVTLFGTDGGQQLSLEALEALGGCFPYEVMCVLNKRVPRVYLYRDKIIGMQDNHAERFTDFEASTEEV